MDAEHAGQLQLLIARDLTEQAPQGWSSLRALATSVDGVTWFDALADMQGGSDEVRFFPDEATIASDELQMAMYEPGKGTWISMECSVELSGAYHFLFNYDQPATFGDREPLEGSWINELRRHPRPWALIPQWHPVKQKFTEQEWAADVARDQSEQPGA